MVKEEQWTASDQEIVDLTCEIAKLEELAWGYEDREQSRKASEVQS